MDAARGAAARRPTALKRQTSLVVPAVVTQGFRRFVDLRFVDAGRVRWLGVDGCPPGALFVTHEVATEI